eukprot:gene25874-11545_t
MHCKMIEVTVTDMLASTRLLLPSFVDILRQRVSCTAMDQLVVIPFATNRLVATRSSSPFGCGCLGLQADALGGVKDQPGYLTSVPYRVAKIDRSRPAAELIIAMGQAPVTWEFYPFWGQKPSFGWFLDGTIQYSVPGSKKQAQDFMTDCEAGAEGDGEEAV